MTNLELSKVPILKYFSENGNSIGQSSVVVRKKNDKDKLRPENREKFSKILIHG